jgi:2-methylcitrate dehydratase PrpD
MMDGFAVSAELRDAADLMQELCRLADRAEDWDLFDRAQAMDTKLNRLADRIQADHEASFDGRYPRNARQQ